MYRFNRLIAVAVIAAALSSSHAYASPRTEDGPLGPISRIVRVLQRLLHLTPNDEPVPPRP